MKKYRTVLFDVDGVLIKQPKLFSELYCEKYNKDLAKLLPFYSSSEFLNCSIGAYDLKQAILDHHDKWQWDGDTDQLLAEWFEAENYPNTALISLVKTYRENGIRVSIVTQQEKYRASFLKSTVFRGQYDDFFVSCELNVHKNTHEFWQKVLASLQPDEPRDIAYFDDKQSLVDTAKVSGINGFLYTSVDDVVARLS